MIVFSSRTVISEQDFFPNLLAGQWYQFPSSTLVSVNPCPANNCSYSGGEGQPAIMDDWSGGAFDTDLNYLIVFGGGHAGSAENTVYRFGPLTAQNPAWSRAIEPSTSVQQTVLHYNDETPSSRHTYAALDYHPGRREFFSLSAGGTWSGVAGDPAYGYPVDSFNFGTGQWKTDWNANFGVSGSIGAVSAYNANDGCFWYHGSTASSPLVRYDPRSGNGIRTDYAANEYLREEGTAAIDTVRNNFVVIGRSGATRQMLVWDLDSPNTAPSIPTTTGAAGGIALESISGPGFVYDPVGDRFIGWGGGSAVYALNPVTWEWSQISLSAQNTVTPTAANSRGTYGRFRYVPLKHGVIVVNTTTSSVYFFKL